MIKQEQITINNKNFIKTYSDINHCIKQLPTEMIYDIAIDVENAPYTYIETDEKIEIEEENKE